MYSFCNAPAPVVYADNWSHYETLRSHSVAGYVFSGWLCWRFDLPDLGPLRREATVGQDVITDDHGNA
jgi:hypothetical protein